MKHLLLLAGLAAAGNPAADVPEWRDILNCGPNCLYMMLAMHGRRVDYRTVREAVDVGSRGSSFAQLAEAAGRLGLPTAVVRCEADALAGRLPAIVHLDMMDGTEGHFVLLLGFDRDNAYIVETSNAEVVPMRRSMFLQKWTGVALVRGGYRIGMGPLFAGIAGLAIWWKIAANRRRTLAEARP